MMTAVPATKPAAAPAAPALRMVLNSKQQWTVLSLLAAVILFWMVAAREDRAEDRAAFVSAINNFTNQQKENTAVLATLLIELKLVAQAQATTQAHDAAARKAAVDQILREVEAVPTEVVNELQRRK